MADHTPTPWFLAGLVQRDAPAVREHPSLPSKYWEIGESEVDFPPALACVWHGEDARFIITAVNAHDELLATLEAVRSMLVGWQMDKIPLYGRVLAAIAKATGI